MSYARNSGFFVGDSIISYNWFGPITSHIVDLENRSTGGKGVVGGLTPNITESWNTNWPNRKSNCDFAILQGGVNDIKSFSVLPAAIKTAFQLLLDDAIADVGADRVFVQNIAPWKNHAAWTSTYQSYTDDMNDWFSAQAVAQGFNLIDINTAWAGVDPDDLKAEYDSGDGIHPSQAGIDVQTALYETAFTNAGVLNMAEPTNTNKLWRGAIEPASIGATGNEYKAWRGAVEPAVVSGGTIRASQGINIAMKIGL